MSKEIHKKRQICESCKELEAKIAVLSQQKKALEQQLQDCKQRNLYLLADFENYRKHIDKQSENTKYFANEKLLRDLLAIVDDLERAITAIKNKEDRKGMLLIYNNLMKLLHNYDVKKIDCLGKPLDSNLAEVLMQEESDKEEGIVLEELQKGYTYKGKVLRFAKVIVSKKSSLEKKQESENNIDINKEKE